ncbi:hypothetical protein CALVIDRAFT_601897, partial [Calocera viscosa TUFC12733]
LLCPGWHWNGRGWRVVCPGCPCALPGSAFLLIVHSPARIEDTFVASYPLFPLLFPYSHGLPRTSQLRPAPLLYRCPDRAPQASGKHLRPAAGGDGGTAERALLCHPAAAGRPQEEVHQGACRAVRSEGPRGNRWIVQLSSVSDCASPAVHTTAPGDSDQADAGGWTGRALQLYASGFVQPYATSTAPRDRTDTAKASRGVLSTEEGSESAPRQLAQPLWHLQEGQESEGQGGGDVCVPEG